MVRIHCGIYRIPAGDAQDACRKSIEISVWDVVRWSRGQEIGVRWLRFYIMNSYEISREMVVVVLATELA